MKDMTFQIEDSGKVITYEILTYVKNPDNDNTYIVYKEENSDTDEVYASKYTIEKGEVILDEITSEKEWDFIENYLDSMEE